MHAPISLDEIPEENGKGEEKGEEKEEGEANSTEEKGGIGESTFIVSTSHFTHHHTLTHHSITPCTPHTYTHTLTSSHPHTSLCHPLIFHIPTILTSSHPHIFTCMYNNTMYRTHLSHSVDHLHLLILTPHPHTLHTLTPSFRCFSKRK